MLHKLQLALFILLIPLAGMFLYAKSKDVSFVDLLSPGAPVLHIGGVPLRVEIADTEAKRIQGLSGREEFTSANGLLFVFDEPGYHGIWMKDMHFPIDVIWIDENLTVIEVLTSIQPSTYPRTFRPMKPAKYIVETNDRYTETFGIMVGKEVTLPQELEKR